MTKEHKKKISEALIRRNKSIEHRKKVSMALKGKSFFRTKPYEWMLNRIIFIAKEFDHSCELTYENLLNFTNTKVCHYCNTEIVWTAHKSKFAKPSKGYQAYNLDRKDNSKGYSVENCVVCCPTCNKVKGNVFTYDEMIKLGKTIEEIWKIR